LNIADPGASNIRRLRQSKPVSGIATDRVAALIAWMLVVRVGNLVKDGAKRRRLRRSSILDKIANANRVPSKRSRPPSVPSYTYF